MTQKKFLTQNFFNPKIFNYKNSLTTNQMGFDTIEINLVCPVIKKKLFLPYCDESYFCRKIFDYFFLIN